MAVLRTLVATVSFDVWRRSVTYTSRVQYDSPGFYHSFSRGNRPAYEFELTLYPLKRHEAEYFEHFHAYHQGAKSFMYDGGPYGRVENYNPFDEGDGTTREFYLPVRWVTATSFAFQTRNIVTGATSNWAASSSNGWPSSLNANIGLLTFSNSSNTIPASGDELRAIYANRYRCLFEPDGFKIAEFAAGLYRAELKLTEVFIFTDVTS